VANKVHANYTFLEGETNVFCALKGFCDRKVPPLLSVCDSAASGTRRIKLGVKKEMK
jgi:hypothetical protein